MCPICGQPRIKSNWRLLKTCGKKPCVYELSASQTRGNKYGNRGGGPGRSTGQVTYSAVHTRARRAISKETGCALLDGTCDGRLELALRPGLPAVSIAFSKDHRNAPYYTGLDTENAYRYLCRSHHSREGGLVRAWALVDGVLTGRDAPWVGELRRELLEAFFGEDVARSESLAQADSPRP